MNRQLELRARVLDGREQIEIFNGPIGTELFKRMAGIDPNAVSPWWIQRRLFLSGIRAISPAVDVTNYVMLELGHPMHAHDRSLITGGFQVRFAEPGRRRSDVQRSSQYFCAHCPD